MFDDIPHVLHIGSSVRSKKEKNAICEYHVHDVVLAAKLLVGFS